MIDAGFRPKPAPQSHHGQLPAPRSVQIKPTGNCGELLILIAIEHPGQVLTNAVEYSTDNGETWHNGTYIKGMKGVVHNLPSGVEVLIRVRSIGTNKRISSWSVPVAQIVL